MDSLKQLAEYQTKENLDIVMGYRVLIYGKKKKKVSSLSLSEDSR